MVVSVLKHLEIHKVIFIINIHMIQLIFNLIHLLILQFIYFFLFFSSISKTITLVLKTLTLGTSGKFSSDDLPMVVFLHEK